MTLKTSLKHLKNGQDLPFEDAENLFNKIFDGNVSEVDLEAVLIALRNKGEAVSEIQGAVASMRAHMHKIEAPSNSIDIVGTGGDGHGTLNVSTAASFVVAGCGVPVAKHGNRAASSLSGASDVLTALGLNLNPTWESLEKAINEVGIVFLFAPRHHPAMRHVITVRQKLRTRTIFNLLGPLTNPANVKNHLIGVYDEAWSMPMAQTLKALGSENVWMTHGADAMDEVSTTGDSHAITLHKGILEHRTIKPQDHGIPIASLDDIKGDNAEHNAKAIEGLLSGQHTPYRDIVLLNAACALVMCGKSANIDNGLVRAAASIDSGAAKEKLDALIKVTAHDG